MDHSIIRNNGLQICTCHHEIREEKESHQLAILTPQESSLFGVVQHAYDAVHITSIMRVVPPEGTVPQNCVQGLPPTWEVIFSR